MTRYSLKTPEKVATELAQRLKRLRLGKGWKQLTLAERSGVSLASLRRFETSGKISLESLLKLVFVLNRLDDFDTVLEASRASSIAELEAAEAQRGRQRGRI